MVDDQMDQQQATPEDEAAITPEEDMNLVALLDAERPVQRFPLPGEGGQPSETYYIEARRWTFAQEQKYLMAGMQLSMPVTGGRKRQPDMANFNINSLEQYRVLVEESIVGFHLKRGGKDVQYTGHSSVWPVFRDLPPAVARWVQRTLQEFQGLEIVEGEQGEA